MISELELSTLFKNFPHDIELSYETIIHKTLQNTDFVLAIPEGKKYFAWFTSFKSQNVCVLLEITENKKICHIEMVTACFHSELAYGTIFYGTLFEHSGSQFFSTEDIYYYKGRNDVSKYSFLTKLDLFSHIYSREIIQVSYNSNKQNHNVIFGLPIISSSITELINNIELLPYPIKYIQFISAAAKHKYTQNTTLMKYDKHSQSNNNYQNILTFRSNMKREIVFKIKADIQNDIYKLFYTDNEQETFYDFAYITDYKTSVMMNKLFRIIKENQNLDALEESDDEEEFENNKIDKFVYLERTYTMLCVYNYKFKRWMPLRLAGKNERAVTKRDLCSLEK